MNFFSFLEREITVPTDVSRLGKRYHKTELTWARPATHEDSMLDTPAGPTVAELGGLVAKSNIGDKVYPISPSSAQYKKRATDFDADGYAGYATTEDVRARQIFWPFGFRVLRRGGKEYLHARFGEWVAVGEESGGVSVVRRRIFRQTYTKVS